jgi:hypothetical protein
MSTNPLYASLDMLISPVTALETVKDKKGWWLVPFVLCTGSLVGLFLYYFANVDFAWLKETMVDQMALNKDMSDEELQAVSDYFTKTPLLWSTTIGGSLSLVVMNAILALYLMIVTKLNAGDNYGFGAWFGFSWWISMPHVVAALLSILMLMFSTTGMIALEDIGVTTLNSLIFGVDASSAWFGFLTGLDILMFWSIALIAMGLQSWLGYNIKKSAMIATAPFALIYGAWALSILFSS